MPGAYVTDGYHLYELEGYERNYGRVGGLVWIVRDVASDRRRRVWPLEQMLCEPVARTTG